KAVAGIRGDEEKAIAGMGGDEKTAVVGDGKRRDYGGRWRLEATRRRDLEDGSNLGVAQRQKKSTTKPQPLNIIAYSCLHFLICVVCFLPAFVDCAARRYNFNASALFNITFIAIDSNKANLTEDAQKIKSLADYKFK
ncbi:hypothetical protein LINGRAHAP2_LOCUS11266, partial [Linum grandiflorum]